MVTKNKFYALIFSLISIVAAASYYSVGGGSGGGCIGCSVSGGTDNYVLFIHPDGTLAQDSDLQFDADTSRFTLGGTDLFTTSVDPAAGGGVSATPGSLAFRNNAGVGSLYVKFGAGNTDWSSVALTSDGYVPYTGATADVNLGSHFLTAETVFTDVIAPSNAGNTSIDVEDRQLLSPAEDVLADWNASSQGDVLFMPHGLFAGLGTNTTDGGYFQFNSGSVSQYATFTAASMDVNDEWGGSTYLSMNPEEGINFGYENGTVLQGNSSQIGLYLGGSGTIIRGTTTSIDIGTGIGLPLNVNTNNTVFANPIILPSNAATDPAIQFTGSSSNTGIFLGGTDVLGFSTNGTQRMFISAAGTVGIGTGLASATAALHLRAGTTAASSAPLKFTSGSLQTTAEAGAVEFLTDKWYGTITTGAARKEFTLNDAALTSGRVPFATTNGRLTDASTLTFSGGTLTATAFSGSGASLTGVVTSVGLSVPATSILGVTGSPVTSSGTLGLTTTGTSGGIPYFSSSSQLASSAALTANAITLGGGAGAAPVSLGSLGTTTTVLHGNAAGAPTFGAVSLTGDVSGVLPLANGGSNKNMTAVNGGVVWTDADSMEVIAAGTSGQVLQSNGAGAPSWVTSSATVPTSEVTYDGVIGMGSTDNKIVQLRNSRKSAGSNITYANNSTNGTTFTVGANGIYSISATCGFDGTGVGGINCGVTINDSALTTNVRTTTYAQGLRCLTFAGVDLALNSSSCSWTGHLTNGDIIRLKTDGGQPVDSQQTMVTITQINN